MPSNKPSSWRAAPRLMGQGGRARTWQIAIAGRAIGEFPPSPQECSRITEVTGYGWADFILERLVSLEQAGGRTRFGCRAMRLVGSLVRRFGRQAGKKEGRGRWRMRQADGRVGGWGRESQQAPGVLRSVHDIW